VAIDELKMAASIKAWCDIYKPRLVCFDKYATQTIADRLANSGVITEDVSGQQFYKACGDLLRRLGQSSGCSQWAAGVHPADE
jgi:hypothetical protein